MEHQEQSTSYFIAKCHSFQHLRRCMETNVWACSQRKQPPQPKDILTNAFLKGPVYLIFSVNNCHGWHGYAKVLGPPGSAEADSRPHTDDQTTKQMPKEICEAGDATPSTNEMNSSLDDAETWYRFEIQWCRLYLREHGEQCLPFTDTADLFCDVEKQVPLNKARNFQIVNNTVGQDLVDLLTKHYDNLSALKVDKNAAKELKMKEKQLFSPGESRDVQKIWSMLCHRVSTLGKIHLACVFGSQRYNLHTEESDVDMFVVYEADANDVLCFHPPQQTIKNHENEACDYTVHEVYRYCELLLTGDPRCVETLFMHPSTIFFASEDWKELVKHRKQFMTRSVLEKYLRDGLGSKGTKQMEKLVLAGEAQLTPMPKKICKLFYIIIRLLQNALNIARREELLVYRPEGSPERQLLLNTRDGQYTYDYLKSVVDRLIEEIHIKKELLMKEHDEPMELLHQRILEKWLLNLRYKNLKTYFGETS